MDYRRARLVRAFVISTLPEIVASTGVACCCVQVLCVSVRVNLSVTEMVFCCAFGCNNSDKSRQQHGLSFHRFPKDLTVRKQWVHALRLQSLPANFDKTGRVCSAHFTASDFQRDLKAELLCESSRRKLKEGAVPSVFSFSAEPAAKRVRRCAAQRLDRSRVRLYICFKV